MTNTGPRSPGQTTAPSDPNALIRHILARLKFGAIKMTVHEGRLAQVKVTEKHRFT